MNNDTNQVNNDNKKIVDINISIRTWYDKYYGNMYVSTKTNLKYNDNNFSDYIITNMQYGSDDQAIDIVLKNLNKLGLIELITNYERAYKLENRLGLKINISSKESLKRDMFKNEIIKIKNKGSI